MFVMLGDGDAVAPLALRFRLGPETSPWWETDRRGVEFNLDGVAQSVGRYTRTVILRNRR